MRRRVELCREAAEFDGVERLLRGLARVAKAPTMTFSSTVMESKLRTT
jgi:hypothetical protein